MTSPLSFLGPAIELIGTNAHVLPATGGAFEDMARPDVEEADDRFLGSKTDAQEGFQDFAETPAPDWRDLYRKTPPVFRNEKHVFRYFCDGSIKTYFIGTVIEGERSYPLELTQIGSAIVHRKEDGTLDVAKFERQILLLVPHTGGGGISESLFTELRKLANPLFRVIDVEIPDDLSKARQDPRDKAGAKARFEMHLLETRLITEFADRRAPEEWTVIDGGVRRLKSTEQNPNRPKTNQPRKINRQKNTNYRSLFEISHTENRITNLNPTPKNSFRRFPAVCRAGPIRNFRCFAKRVARLDRRGKKLAGRPVARPRSHSPPWLPHASHIGRF